MLVIPATQAAPKVQGWGRVNMQGAIIDTACAIAAGSRDQTIDMDVLPLGNIARDGQGNTRPFTIELINCTFERPKPNLPNWKQFQVVFDGDADGELFGVRGDAKGVALQISDGQGNIAAPGVPLPRGDISPEACRSTIPSSWSPIINRCMPEAIFLRCASSWIITEVFITAYGGPQRRKYTIKVRDMMLSPAGKLFRFQVLGLCITLALGSSSTRVYAEDGIQFNTDILDVNDRKNIDLSQFSRSGYIMPGSYSMVVHINKNELPEQKYRFIRRTAIRTAAGPASPKRWSNNWG